MGIYKKIRGIFSKQEIIASICLFVLFLGTYFLVSNEVLSVFPHIDIILHFLGGFFVALFFVGYFEQTLLAEKRFWGDLIIILGASILVGVLWEVFEYLMPIVTNNPRTIFGGGDLFDTLKDLIVDTLGAATMFFLPKKC